MVPPQKLVTIMGRGHSAFLDGKDTRELTGDFIEQPDEVGTAPWVFLGATHVRSQDRTG